MRKTYITSISTDSYLAGVLVLDQNLKKLKSKYPLAVLVSKGVSEQVIKKLKKRKIQVIRANQKVENENVEVNNKKSGLSHWNHTLDKLLIFGLTQFDKIVFLDSDLWILENLDFLFEKPHMTATRADNVFRNWNYLNSGTMVIEPNPAVLNALLEKVGVIHTKRDKFSDQDVIQEVYSDWINQNELILPQKYNIFIYFLENYCREYHYHLNGTVNDNSIAIVHFAGKVKPWMWEYKTNIWSYLRGRKWNSIFVSGRYIIEVLKLKAKGHL